MGSLLVSHSILRDDPQYVEAGYNMGRGSDCALHHTQRLVDWGKNLKTLLTWATNVITLVVIVVCLFQWFAPTAFWMTVNKLYVHDVVIGGSPAINVDFAFHQKFYMHWHASVRKAVPGEPAFFGFCVSDGATETYPGRQLPLNIDITYWMRPVPCVLPLGTYYLETTWSWQIWLISREFTVQSNVFKVVATADALTQP